MEKPIQLFPESIDKAIAPSLGTLGGALNAVFLTALMPLQKLGIRKEIELEEYAATIRKKISKIPQENLILPPLHVAGPILEASKYYIDSEILREMFASLLASSMDKAKADIVHPAFVEVIKQLSPFDATFIKEIIQEDGFYPLITIHLPSSSLDSKFETNAFFRVFQNYYYSGLQNDVNSFTDEDPHAIAICLHNLDRLGIISISEVTSVSDPTCYEEIWQQPSCRKIVSEHIEELRNASLPKFTNPSNYSYSKHSFTRTNFGISFIKSCV